TAEIRLAASKARASNEKFDFKDHPPLPDSLQITVRIRRQKAVAIHNGCVVRDGRSEISLLSAAAAWGLATAISLWRLFAHPAPAGQVGGFMSAHNLDARGPQQHIFFVVALTIAAVFIARMFAARFIAGG